MTQSKQLLREAEAKRAGLAETLGHLKTGVTGQAIAAELTGVARDASLSLVKTLGESARNNPGAALLIGAGITMLLTKTSGGDVVTAANSALRAAASAGSAAASSVAGTVGGAASSVADGLRTTAGAVKGHHHSPAGTTGDIKGAVSGIANTVKDMGEQTMEATRGVIDQVRRTAHDGRDAADGLLKEGERRAHEMTEDASRLARDARQSMTKLFEEQPVLVAAVGAAIGALVGAALPLSRAEGEVLGTTGAKALDVGLDVVDKAKTAVGEELKSGELGPAAGEAAGRLVDAIVPVPRAD